MDRVSRLFKHYWTDGFCRSWLVYRFFIAALITGLAIGCNTSSDSATVNTPASESLELDARLYTDSIPGAAVAYSEQSFSWNNAATDQSGPSEFITLSFCTDTIWNDCTEWKAVIPLTDGANEITLSGGGRIYTETIMHTDNGPPEVDYHSSNVSLCMSQWPEEISVSFDELIDTDSIDNSTFYVMNSSGGIMSGSIKTDDSGAKMSISGPPGETFTAVVTTGVADYWGTPMSAEYTWQFEFSCGWVVYMGYECAPCAGIVDWYDGTSIWY
jgi:hypothetical protein